ncbi:MAG: hypothetical protein AAF871_15185 [Pseudomonadota bacterium]
MARIIAIVLGLMAPIGAAADTQRPTILVDREPSGIAIYFATPAPMLEDVFGQGAEALLTPEGVVDIEGLYQGTFETADEIFRDVEVFIDGEPVAMEGLSMMVHDPAILPPFDSPLTAAMSIAVCNSPETVGKMGLDELVAFMGFFAWKADPGSEVTLRFPELGREPISFDLFDFGPTGVTPVETEIVADGGSVTLNPAVPVRGASLNGLLVAIGAIAAFVILATGKRRRAEA